MGMHFGFIPVSPSELLTEEELNEIIAGYERPLEDIGGERWTQERLDERIPVFYFAATGGTESAILALRGERSRSAPDEPAFLLAHPANNSLPAALEVLARLQQDGVPGRIFYLKSPGDTDGYRQIAEAVHDREVGRALREARVGMVGTSSDWLVASKPNPVIVQQVWGPEVVPIDLQVIEQALPAITEDAIAHYVASLANRALAVLEPTQTEIEKAVRVYVALKRMVEQHRLDALTVRCFDLVLRLQTTGCFGLAQLADEGIIAGCEGDLVSTVGLLWAHKLLGQVAWMANPAQLNETRNRLWLAHCTVPCSIVQRYRLRSHFESGLGVSIEGTLPSGPVTLFRIGGKAMDRLWLAEGNILRAGDAEDLCRTQAEIQLTHGGSVRDLLRRPLGNHLVLVLGHHRARLQTWWETMVEGHGSSKTASQISP